MCVSTLLGQLLSLMGHQQYSYTMEMPLLDGSVAQY